MTTRPWMTGPWAATEHSWSDAGIYSTTEEVRIAGLSIRDESEDEPENVVKNLNMAMVANASLIAAAPDLAEALIELLQWEPTRADYDHQPEKRADLQYASAKAQFDRARSALEKAGWKP